MAAKYIKKEPVKRVPFKPSYPPSEEQEKIFASIKDSSDNVHVNACPGSGKSTTIKWAMTLNKERNSAFLAFNKAIVTDIEPNCPADCKVATAHSFGYKALASRFGRLFVYQNKVKSIVQDAFKDYNPSNFTGKEKGPAFARMNNACDLVSKIKVNMTDENSAESVIKVADQYNIDLDLLPNIHSMLPEIFKQIEEKPQSIDFDDMIYLPIKLGLDIPKYRMIYIDESHDLSTLLTEYAFRMASERIMSVADRNQSIYAFAGADIKSVDRLVEKFGSIELPLATCYRCPKSVVALAATVYNMIQPFDKNEEGVVEYRDDLDYEMPEGSMILARRNSSLIKPYFNMVKRGRKAIIKGREIGSAIIKLIDGMNANDIHDLIDKISIYREARIEKLMKHTSINTGAIELISDQCDCVVEIATNCSDLDEMKFKIDKIFDESSAGIVLSSIHRSKGLEADHVSIWEHNRISLNTARMSDDDHVQEKNLRYVAYTRAKKVLHLVK